MRRASFWSLGCLATAVAGLAFVGAGTRDEEPEAKPVKGVLWRGAQGITETVAQIMERQSKVPASVPGKRADPRPLRRHGLHRQDDPASPAVSHWPPADPSISAQPEPQSPQSIGANFEGVSYFDSGELPPDTIGAVGPTQILIVVNGRVRVLSKSGVVGDLDVDLTVFFDPVSNNPPVWDPQVRYDRLSGRFFVTALNTGVPNWVLIAVSSGPAITDSTSFTFFSFRQDLVSPPGHADGWADFDGLGVDRLSLYIAADIGSAFPDVVFLATDGFVVNKADLLNGVLTVTAFRDMYPGGNASGPDDPRGVSNDDPAAGEGYFIGTNVNRLGSLVLRRITYPGGVPAISDNINLTVPKTNAPLLVPHAGTPVNRRLQAADDRLFVATIFTNKLTGVSSLWTAHNIEVDSNGVANSHGGRDGARWYEIRDLSTTPTLFQSGTLFDPTTGSTPRFFFFPSVAMSGQGHAALGSSTAGVPYYADAAVAGRFSDDPLGTLRPFALATSSDSSYLVDGADGQRWGDYSQTVVDPNDDMTMWTFQEYCNQENSWGVRVVQLLAPPPAMPAGAAPSTVCQGVASAGVIVTGTSSSGSGFFDPGPDTGGPGFANHISASVSGGVAVNGIVFNSPTQVTLDLSTLGASPGAKSVTITNPDGQSMTGTSLLTVTAQPASPVAGNSGPICAGGTLQLSASTVPGATYSWTGPNGFTSSQQNPSIPGATAAASGTYTVRATAAGCASAPATTAATVSGNGGACNDGNGCTLGETCASGVCQGGSPRDADGDAHVDGLCGGNDCNDANPSVWFVPVEVTGLMVTTASPADPAWDSQGSLVGPGTTYDLVSGSLSSSPGIDFSAGACLQPGGRTSFGDTRPDPAVGSGFWYLARARNVCGSGTYGSSQRDAAVPPCP